MVMATKRKSQKKSVAAGDGVAAPGGPVATGTGRTAGLSVGELARALRVPEETIRRHVGEGLPTNDDATISLVVYVAWLIFRRNEKETGRG